LAIARINVTTSPTAEWIARQITEAFPWDGAPRYMIRDRIFRPIQQIGIIRSHPILGGRHHHYVWV
jgi:hypothetical protein